MVTANMTSAQRHEAEERASECKPKQQGRMLIALTKLTIPAGLNFADLALEREPVTLCLMFLPGPLAELCRHNARDPVAVLADEDLSCWLICEWYLAHVLAGGAPDPVAEEILAEIADNLQPGAGLEH